MRSDLIIGIIVSLALHLGVAFGDRLLPKKAHKAQVVEEEAPTIQVIPPPPPPEEVETVDLTEPTPAEASAALAPPSLMDVPQVVQIDSFTQQLQPPPPPSLGKPTGAMTIPPGRPNTGLSGKSIGDVFNVRDLDQIPSKKGLHAEPTYPFEMKRAGITGEVTVQFIVDSNGDVRDAVVIKSSQREFEASAIQAVLKWKWKPGKKGGKVVNTRMVIPIVFNLNED